MTDRMKKLKNSSSSLTIWSIGLISHFLISQPTSSLVKDDHGDMLADSHKILNRWKNYFSQFLNVHRVRDVYQTEINTAVPLVPNSNPSEVEPDIANLNGEKRNAIGNWWESQKKGDH
jgi:hypothetical protein